MLIMKLLARVNELVVVHMWSLTSCFPLTCLLSWAQQAEWANDCLHNWKSSVTTAAFTLGWIVSSSLKISDSTDSTDSLGHVGFGFKSSGQSLSTVLSSFVAVCLEEAIFLSRRSTWQQDSVCSTDVSFYAERTKDIAVMCLPPLCGPPS